jgi:DNA mismatch endonuclease, patch repair protein
VDTVSPEQRSAIMSRVRSRDTKPEMLVRKLVHGLGYRYRLHCKDLPGNPDIVFRPRRKVIFVHGCFWHGHDCRAGRNKPSSNTDYWGSKLDRNKERDRANQKELVKQGWDILVVWECETRDMEYLERTVVSFLEG